MAGPLNILDVLNSIQAQQPAAAGLPAPTGAPALPGQGDGTLGTVLARLRTSVAGPRGRAILGGGGGARPAPSKGGAIAQGFMQAMDASREFDRQEAAQKRLAELFAYNRSKDERDFAFRKERAAATDAARSARTRAAEGGWRGKEPDPLVTEKRRIDLLKADPDFKRLQDDDDEGIPTRKLPPEQRKALEDRVAARRKEIWSMQPGRRGGPAASVPDDDLADDGDGTTPAAASAPAPAPAPAAPAPRAPAAAAPEPRLAPDGNYYVQQNGRWFRVEGDE
jgi:hypothetical protein